MKKTKQTIETQLDCFATASLQEEIENDMTKQDKSLALLLNANEPDDSKDSADEHKSSHWNNL